MKNLIDYLVDYDILVLCFYFYLIFSLWAFNLVSITHPALEGHKVVSTLIVLSNSFWSGVIIFLIYSKFSEIRNKEYAR